jgi:teichuronic acid biosynthesis glycosyltransferase TuaC
MKILFVRSGNSGTDTISSIQGDSLQRNCMKIYYYNIIGRGIVGYLKNLYSLRRYVKENKIKLVHAHYSYSGVLSILSYTGVPVVVSLMGTDVLRKSLINTVFNKLILKKANFVIVKSPELNQKLPESHNKHIIPNGVNMSLFQPSNHEEARKALNWDANKIHILFASYPERMEKNYPLAEAAIRILAGEGLSVETHYIKDIPFTQMPDYYNAADVLLLTSFYEGSPNVIKEAMACNCPIVSTPVGDVAQVINGTEGCYLSTFEAEDVAERIKSALPFSKTRTSGREHMTELDEINIAKKIISLYHTALKNKYKNDSSS